MAWTRWNARRTRGIVARRVRRLRYRGYYTRHQDERGGAAAGRARGRICEQRAHRGHNLWGNAANVEHPEDVGTATVPETSKSGSSSTPFWGMGIIVCLEFVLVLRH